jgi:nucleoside-diphosphate-sugar epimerase
MKILVTGGSGFIGTNLINYYLIRKAMILNVDIKPPRNKDHELLWREADIRDFTVFKTIVEEFKPDYVLHLAARADLTGKTLKDYSSNIEGVENVIKICNEISSIRKVIFTSTMLVCKAGYIPESNDDYCPPNLYGESKVIGEKLVKDASPDLNYCWSIIRPTSIWGPWFGPTYREFFEMIMNKKYFNFTGKTSVKTYGFIGNSIYQIDMLLMSNLTHGRTFYIGDYEPINIKEWAVEIAHELNYSLLIVPRFVIWLSSKIGDILQYFSIRFPMNSFRFKNMTTDNIIPLEETKKYAPMTLFTRNEGNRLTIEWMRDHYF